MLLQALAISRPASTTHELDPSHRRRRAPVLEALKLALADRDAHYGDPDAARRPDVPLEVLLSQEYAADAPCPDRRRGLATSSGRARSARHGVPAAAGDRATGRGGAPASASRRSRPRADVAATPATSTSSTAGATSSRRRPSGGWLQSSPTIPEPRLLPGHPAADDLARRARSPSALRPGRRPRTTLTPDAACCATASPCAAVGTPGGDQQDQWQLLYLLRTLVGGYTPQQAIDAPGAAHDLDARARSGRAPGRRRRRRGGPARRRTSSPSLERRGHVVDARRRLVAGPALRRDPRPGDRACSRPPPTREERRAMPSDAEAPTRTSGDPLLSVSDLEVSYPARPCCTASTSTVGRGRAGRPRRRVRARASRPRSRPCSTCCPARGRSPRGPISSSTARTSTHADERPAAGLRGERRSAWCRRTR